LVAAVTDYLEDHGFEVSSVGNGLAARSSVMAKKPALVILDVDMPIMNGVEVLEQLRSDPLTKTIPVILMTGVTSSLVYPFVQGKTSVSHVKKPVDPADLLSLIRNYIPSESV
jgi:CheY-like chemotaxis protein